MTLTPNINLNLLLGNAEEADLPENFFDAVYLDAFSPNQNPELWTSIFFKHLKPSMKEGAKLSTYSAKGDVRRSLIEVGFEVFKSPGPKGKREMLVAINY
jgi:tRNA U34 5-methylaminomethyl-2-thiouridine-forming methyltransferase MnmC